MAPRHPTRAKAPPRFRLVQREPVTRFGKTLRTGATLRELEPIEIASRDRIVALQVKRLKWTLQHAYQNVPHYRRTFDAVGAHPSDFKRLEDLVRFPFTTKEDLRQAYPYGMFAVPRDQASRFRKFFSPDACDSR